MMKAVKEIVVYRIKEDKVELFKEQGLQELVNCAKSFEGMKVHESFQSIKDPQVFVDFVEWDSLELAEKASAELDQKTKAGELPLMMETFDRVELFDHLQKL